MVLVLDFDSIIYQLLDIRMDDQLPEGEIRRVIYQTRYFVPNILCMIMLFISWHFG